MVERSLKTELLKLNNITVSDKVDDYLCTVLSSLVFSTNKSCDRTLALDIGIGTLFMNIDNSIVSYKFEPSSNLSSKIRESLKEGKDLLIDHLNDRVEQSLYKIYKELFKC